MIKYKSYKLQNGLTVISDYIADTPMATFSIGYKVGSKHENPQLTGLAHLFEHLMFGGSKKVLNFDQQVEMAGGTNNAFTTADYTNYYISLPAVNIETAYFLEADRMFYPNLSEQTLEIQRKVVIEEYKQRVLNPPYGDLMLNLLPQAYQNHPYRWPVIGADISHIERITIEDVKAFHEMFYNPSNAVIAVSGNVNHDKVFELAEKWFGHELKMQPERKSFPKEEPQCKPRIRDIKKDVPLEMIVMAYHMGPRDSREFYQADLLSDVLSFDRSSRFHQYLKRTDAVFTSLSASVTGYIENGLFLIKGKLNEGCSVDQGIQVIDAQLKDIKAHIAEDEVKKVINKLITYQKVGYLEHANRAMDLCYADIVKDPEYINDQFVEYQKTTRAEIQNFALRLFNPDNRNVLIYRKK